MDTTVIASASGDAAAPGARTLLIVDDHPGFRVSVRALLEATGDLGVVGEAVSGADAVEAAARLHPDIIVMDIVLPDIDGITACELIMRDASFQPAIVLVSSRDPAAYGPRLHASPARGFIAKDQLTAAALLALAWWAVMSDLLFRIADPTVGVVLGGCGTVLSVRRRRSLIGPLMLLACGCWFAGSLWSVALFLHRGPLVHVHISYPTGRIRRPLAVATVTCAYLTSLLEALASNPWVTLGTAFLVAVTAADIYARTSGPARKAGGPALGAALAFAAVLALSAADQLLLWQYDRLILMLYDLVITVVVVLLTIDLLSGRWSEATVADFVTQLGARSDPSALTRAVRRTLGDPTAQIGVWLAGQHRYIDDTGTPVEPPRRDRHRSVVEISDDHGGPAALLIYAQGVDQQLITDVTNALRLALGNARLRADVLAQVTELGQIRRRLVEAADHQRRQLETDLADGPQRHLSQTARLLAQASTEVNPSLRARLLDMHREVATAQQELHELTFGIRPAVLETGGLAAALPPLAKHANPGARITFQVSTQRLPPAVEGALYFVCSESLTNTAKHATATEATVEIDIHDGAAVTRICDDGKGGADPGGAGLRGLRDRVEALDGTLTVSDRVGGGTTVEVRIPIKEPLLQQEKP